MCMFDTRKIGRKIAELRKTKNMTQMELAEIFECSIDELLCNSKETELVSHIISGDTEEYIKEHQVTLETIVKTAAVLKPNQTESLMDMVINENMDKLTTHDLIEIAPFL